MRGLKLACAAALLAGILGAQMIMPSSGNCKETPYEEEGGYQSGYACFYPKQTILQTYLNYRKEFIEKYPDDNYYEALRSKLEVGKDYNDTIGEDYLWINYKWSGKNELNVEMEMSGGGDIATFTHNNSGTQLRVICWFQ